MWIWLLLGYALGAASGWLVSERGMKGAAASGFALAGKGWRWLRGLWR